MLQNPPTLEKIAEFNALKERIQRHVAIINAPLINFLSASAVDVMGKSWIHFLEIVSEDYQGNLLETDNRETFVAGFMLGVGIIMVPVVYCAYKNNIFIYHRVNNFFPNGISYPRAKLLVIEQIPELLSRKELDESIIKLKAHFEMLEKTANKVIWWGRISMAGWFAMQCMPANLLTNIVSFFSFTKAIGYLPFMGFSTDAKNIYNKLFGISVKEQLTRLNQLVPKNVEWNHINAKDPKASPQFCLSFFNKDQSVELTIAKQPIILPAKVYLRELKDILKQAKQPILSRSTTHLYIGLGPIFNEETLKTWILRRCENYRNFAPKRQQLNYLTNIFDSADWYVVPKTDEQYQPITHFVFNLLAVSEPGRNPFLQQLNALYGDDVLIENDYVSVKGCKLAELKDIKNAARALKDLSAQKQKIETSEQKAEPSSTFELERPASNQKKSTRHSKFSAEATEQKVVLKQKTPTMSFENIIVQLKRTDDEEINPMYVPWAKPGTYFSCFKPRKFSQLNDTQLIQFKGIFSSGVVKGKGDKSKSSGTAIVPNNENYTSLDGNPCTADFKAKTTNNIRIPGTIVLQCIVEEQQRVVVEFNGLTLKAH